MLATLMVEIGTTGWPWRASGIAIGTALAAEADGAHVVWFADRIALPVTADEWARAAGPLLPLVPDPDDVADPVVTATAALLVTRDARVGILGWRPGDDATRAARTLASLADLAPDRAVVALEGAAPVLQAVAAALGPAPIELAVLGGPPDVAAALGWGWIAVAVPADELAKAAGDAGVTGPVGVHLPVLVHDDPEIARRALHAPLLAPLLDAVPADGMVVGGPDRLAAVIDEYVERGVERIVLDDLLAFGAPEAFEAGRNAVRAGTRSARLRHRPLGTTA
jgi:hypothetical protein